VPHPGAFRRLSGINEIVAAEKFWSGNLKGRYLLGALDVGREDNIKMFFGGTGCERVECIQVAQDTDNGVILWMNVRFL